VKARYSGTIEAQDYGTMSLGTLIDALTHRPRDEEVRFDFGYMVPQGLGSYRGYYYHLALGYKENATVRVADLLKELRAAVGQTFEGYKGGDFTMSRDTPIWVANYSECPGTTIVGLADCRFQTVILTSYAD
jgi:hypothetical protein